MRNNDLPTPYGVLYRYALEYDTDAPETSNAAIELLEPEFKGIVFRYGVVSYQVDEANDCLRVKFDYDIIKGKVSKNRKTDFELLLGNLLYDMTIEKEAAEALAA